MIDEWWCWLFYDGVFRCTVQLYMPMPMTSGWYCQWCPTMVLMVVVVVVMLFKNMIMRHWLSGKRLQADLVQGGRRQLYLWPGLHSPAHGDNFYHNWSNCITRAPLVFLSEYILKYVSLSISDPLQHSPHGMCIPKNPCLSKRLRQYQKLKIFRQSSTVTTPWCQFWSRWPSLYTFSNKWHKLLSKCHNHASGGDKACFREGCS